MSINEQLNGKWQCKDFAQSSELLFTENEHVRQTILTTVLGRNGILVHFHNPHRIWKYAVIWSLSTINFQLSHCPVCHASVPLTHPWGNCRPLLATILCGAPASTQHILYQQAILPPFSTIVIGFWPVDSLLCSRIAL